MNSRNPRDMPEVLTELVKALGGDDWTRYADDAGHHYYVLGEAAHALEIESGKPFLQMHFFAPAEDGLFEDWYRRAILATELPDYFERARQAGVPPELCDSLSAALGSPDPTGAVRMVFEEWLPRLASGHDWEQVTAIAALVRIARTRSGDFLITDEQRGELKRALELYFLRELAGRYPRIVKRAAALDWLSVSDPQIREASRCYLYGFNRSAVLIAAAAVEGALQAIAGDLRCQAGTPYYKPLVEAVYGSTGARQVDEARRRALLDLFNLRNKIAHGQHDTSPQEAERALDLAREVVNDLGKPARESPG